MKNLNFGFLPGQINSPWWGESTGAARISFRAPVDREIRIRVSSCPEGLKIRVFLILGILEWNLHWQMRLLSRIPMVYSSKIFDERIAGKLQFKVSAGTRKPENQKNRKPEPEPEGPDPNFAGQFWGVKTWRFQKILADLNSPWSKESRGMFGFDFREVSFFDIF